MVLEVYPRVSEVYPRVPEVDPRDLEVYPRVLKVYPKVSEALAEQYKDLHLSGFDDAYLDSSTERLSPTAKRITEGWLCYSLVELKQRYNISGWLKFYTNVKQ